MKTHYVSSPAAQAACQAGSQRTPAAIALERAAHELRLCRPAGGGKQDSADIGGAIELIEWAQSKDITSELLAVALAAVEWAKDAPAPYREWPFVIAARAAIARAESAALENTGGKGGSAR